MQCRSIELAFNSPSSDFEAQADCAPSRTLRTTSHRKSMVASKNVPAHVSHNMMRFVSAPAVPKPATNAANEFPRFLAAIACIGEDAVCREDHAAGCQTKKRRRDTPTAVTVWFVILRVNELTGQTWHFEMLVGQSILSIFQRHIVMRFSDLGWWEAGWMAVTTYIIIINYDKRSKLT